MKRLVGALKMYKIHKETGKTPWVVIKVRLALYRAHIFYVVKQNPMPCRVLLYSVYCAVLCILCCTVYTVLYCFTLFLCCVRWVFSLFLFCYAMVC